MTAISPYRTPGIVSYRGPRSWWKTFQLKVLLRWKGTWRKRWARCSICRKGLIAREKIMSRGGSPGNAFVADSLNSLQQLSCGHELGEHLRNQVFVRINP